MRYVLLYLASVVGAVLLLAGCPAPPPQPGPPPTPQPETQAATDDQEMPPAPVLPDPRSELPPPSEEVNAPPVAPVQPGEQVSSEVSTEGPDTEPSSALEVNVYSVQVFTSSTQSNAEATAQRVRATISEPVEVVQEVDGKWRVYAGRSADRGPIDQLKNRLNAGGFSGCWTKQRLVRTATPDANVPAGQVIFSVQVFVSSNQQNAQRVAGEVRAKTQMPVEVVQMGPYWKVFVGRSPTRDPIDMERDRLRSLGYPDAWTYQRVGTR